MDSAALLAPVSEASPCGDDLSFSAELDAIQDLRRADDPTLDQGEWLTALKVSDWPAVQSACERVLAHRSKDLRVAAWLTEACAKVNGYAGLAEGLELCGALCERFWDELYPRIDADGDTEERSGNLRWLLAKVQELARQLPVLRQGNRGFSLHDIETAQANVRTGVEAADESNAAASAPTPDHIAAAKRATLPTFVAANLVDAQRALQALDRLQTLADEKLGDHGPSFSMARRALEDAAHGIGQLVPQNVAQFAGTAETSVEQDSATGEPTGMLRTRADALRQLRAIADFFRRTEPHSPVAYLAERGAQWGEMPLHEWLRLVVKDQGVLAQVEELLGVPPSQPASE